MINKTLTLSRRHAATAQRALWFGAVAAFATACLSASAADIEVRVLGAQGQPLEDVAVYLTPDEVDDNASQPKPLSQMQQIDGAFVPHILVVKTDSDVSFPNRDNVSHHVYSFSPAKRFQLPLYRGSDHQPVKFDTPGVVALGCNIHDAMLGFILVVDTPWFAVTGADGVARLRGLPEGAARVELWTPRLRKPLVSRTESLSDSHTRKLELRIDQRLKPAHVKTPKSTGWNDY